MRSVPAKVILWLVLFQAIIFLLSYWHKAIQKICIPIRDNKEFKVEFSSVPKLLGTPDHEAIAESEKTKRELEKLQELVKKRKEADSLHQQIQKIEVDTSEEAEQIKIYNYSKDSIFALDNFFQSLYDIETGQSKKLVRVVHYGDSQIEGDRISLYLRKKFHAQFGGGGPGFIPIKDIYTPPSYNRQASENWIRYTMFHDTYINNRYGYGGLVFRFSSPKTNDSSVKKAYIAVSSNKFGKYNRATLLWGNVEAPCDLKVTIGDSVYKTQLPVQQEFGMVAHSFASGTPTIRYDFKATKSPDIYGICLDDTVGVQVDNFALRGHGGQGIFKINPAHLACSTKRSTQS